MLCTLPPLHSYISSYVLMLTSGHFFLLLIDLFTCNLLFPICSRSTFCRIIPDDPHGVKQVFILFGKPPWQPFLQGYRFYSPFSFDNTMSFPCLSKHYIMSVITIHVVSLFIHLCINKGSFLANLLCTVPEWLIQNTVVKEFILE